MFACPLGKRRKKETISRNKKTLKRKREIGGVWELLTNTNSIKRSPRLPPSWKRIRVGSTKIRRGGGEPEGSRDFRFCFRRLRLSKSTVPYARELAGGPLIVVASKKN